jgi:hypothetical protein
MRFLSATTRRLVFSFWLPLLGLTIGFSNSIRLGRAEESKALNNKVISMLAAISNVRLSRDTKFDCSEFVYKYLGHSDQLKYYFFV